MTETHNPKQDENDQLDAALDGLRATARLHKHHPTLSGISPPSGQNPDPDALLTGRRLELAKENPDPADTEATKTLLATYQQPDGWHCPRCEQVFTDPTTFAQHLIEEFNRGFAASISRTATTKTPPTTPKPKL